MNNNFELILKNNQEFINTLNKIAKDLNNNELSFWYDTKNVLNPIVFYENLKSKLNSKKYKDFFNAVFCSTNCIFLVDKNDFIWNIELEDSVLKVNAITKVFENSNLAIKYEKSISMISKNEEVIEILFDLTTNNLTESEADIIYLTTDLNLKPFVEYNAYKIIFPRSNGISFKEEYEKKSIIKRFFKL